jgi:hypothetical protein
MNREFFAIGLLKYGGLGLLILAGLFAALLDLARAILPPPAVLKCVLPPRFPARKPSRQSKPAQINQ